jgi:hypothetical protein
MQGKGLFVDPGSQAKETDLERLASGFDHRCQNTHIVHWQAIPVGEPEALRNCLSGS